jgi:hypothetical protein
MSPDVEGLMSTFSEYVATDPENFSKEAASLIGRSKSILREFIDQMGRAVAHNRAIDIGEVLNLCEAAMLPHFARAGGATQAVDSSQSDHSLSDVTTRFVESVCKATDDDSPRYSLENYRARLWTLLQELCRASPQSAIVRDISQEDPRLHEYLLLGINSMRGRALEAALEYARWVANHVKRVEGDREVVGGFTQMHEVRELIEWQISSGQRSVEALAVLGSRIGLINWIDSEWLTENADNIFDLSGINRDPQETSGWAAWNSFLVWVRPNTDYYNAFRSQFEFAVKQSKGLRVADDRYESPLVHLGRHLVTLYGRGHLPLDSDVELLKEFLAGADAEVRRGTMSFIGQSINHSSKVPQDILKRFQELWRFYWDNFGKDDVSNNFDGWLFGPWFASGQFPVAWALEQLEAFVSVSSTVEPDADVVQQLAEISTHAPAQAVRVLDRMVRGDREGWRVYGWIDDAKKILRVAMQNPGESHEIAKKLVDYLGRRGFSQLAELAS